MNDDEPIKTQLLELWESECGEPLEQLESQMAELREAAGELLPALQQELSEKSDEFVSAIVESMQELADACVALHEAAVELAEVFTEDASTALENCQEQLLGAFDSAESVLTTDFRDGLAKSTDEQSQRLQEAVRTARDQLDEELDLLNSQVHELTAQITSRLTDLQSEWVEKVEDTKEEFERFRDDLESLGNSVATLMEVMDDSMRTTGTGMYAAADILNEVIHTLDGVH